MSTQLHRADRVVVPFRPRPAPEPDVEAIWVRALAACDLITIDAWLRDHSPVLEASEQELAQSWRGAVAATVSGEPAGSGPDVWHVLAANRRDALRRRLRAHELYPACSA